MADNQARRKLALQPSQAGKPRPVVEVHALENGTKATKSYQVRQVGDRLELYSRTPGRDSVYARVNNKVEKIQQVYKVEVYDDAAASTGEHPLFVLETIPDPKAALDLEHPVLDKEGVFSFQGFKFLGDFSAVLSVYSTAKWQFEATLRGSQLSWEGFSFHTQRTISTDPHDLVVPFIDDRSARPRQIGPTLRKASSLPLNRDYPYRWTLKLSDPNIPPNRLLSTTHLSRVISGFPESGTAGDMPIYLVPYWISVSGNEDEYRFLSLKLVLGDHQNRLGDAKVYDYEALVKGVNGVIVPSWVDKKPSDWSPDETSALRLVVRPSATLRPGPAATGSPNIVASTAYSPVRKLIFEIWSSPTRVFIAGWNGLAEVILSSLRQNDAGNPVSFLPKFTPTSPSPASWVMSYDLLDGVASHENQDARFDLIDSFASSTAPRSARIRSLRPCLRSGAGEQLLEAILPNVNPVDRLGAVAGLKVPIRIPAPSQSDDSDDGEGIYFSLNSSIRGTPSPQRQMGHRIRFGSFDLSIGEEPTPTAYNGLKSRGRVPDITPVATTSSARLDIGTSGQILVDSKLDFAMRSWAPGGQDNPPADEFAPTNFSDYRLAGVCEAGMLGDHAPKDDGRSSSKWEGMFQEEVPLTIYLPSSSESPKYVLESTESNADRISHTLDLRTFVLDHRDPSAQSPDAICNTSDPKVLERVFVIDRNPFLVARVAFQPIGTTSPFFNVGRWTNRADQPHGWQVSFAPAKNDSPVCLTLPPQGLGETMLDERNVELSDEEASQYNFGPNTNLYLTLSVEGLSFTTAPWDLRSMFANPQLAPYVQRIDYELLYGLSCQAEKPLLRLLDTFGVIGRVPGRPAPKLVWEVPKSDKLSEPAFEAGRRDWAFVYRRYRNRIGVLEPVPWNAAATQGEAITLNQNLACWFRLPDASNLKLPVALDASDIADQTRLQQLNAGTLAGGATRGFVSKNVYIASVLSPTDRTLARMSSSAQLAQFSFSAIGGNGKQMAGFQNNLTRVYGDVHFGRTYRYKLERIGRIACFWNSAKHVVVYERRVAPSAQFEEDGKQYKGLGWPFLRKVQEYIEIIDDKLEYPSTNGGSTTSDQVLADLKQRRGCITGIQFEPGARFNVSSDWGIDVGDFGWKIPLWNPTANQTIYPRPRFDLRMAPQDTREKEFEPKRFAKPDQVFFFTLTKVPGTNKDPDGDPHKWAPVADIDFCNCPDPQPVADFKNGDPRQYSAPERPSTHGFSPCTFDLETGGAPINLVADRSNSPIVVQISTLTVSRSLATSATLPAIDSSAPFDSSKFNDPSYVLAALKQIESRLTDVFQILLNKFPVNSVFEPGLGTRIKNEVLNTMLVEFAKLRDQVRVLQDKLGQAQFSPQNLQNKIKQVEENATSSIFRRIDTAVDAAVGRAKVRLQDLQTIGFTLARARSIVSDFGAEVGETLLLLGSLPGEMSKFVVRIVGMLNLYRSNVQTEFNAALQRIRSFSSSSSVTLVQCQQQLRIEFAQVNALEDNFLRSCTPFLPQGMTDCFAEVRGGLNNYFGLFDTHLSAAIKATDLTTFQAAIAKDLMPAVQSALASIDQLKVFLGKYSDLAIQAATDWADLLKRIESQLPHAAALISDPWQKAIDQATALVYTDVASIQNEIDTLAKLLKDSSGALRKNLQAYADQAQAAATKAAQLYNDAFQRFYSELDVAKNELTRIANQFEKDANQLQGELIRYKDKLVNSARDWAEQNSKPLLDEITGSNTGVVAYQAADTALRLVRAFGDPPRTAQMRFEQSQLGYYFKQGLPGVDLSPAYLALDQGAAALDALRPLGLRLPCNQILDQLIPSSLQNFDFRNIFPNFAGIDFSNLLSGFKVPDGLDSRHIKVQHGIDPQRRRAFAKAEVNFDLDKTATILDFGPVRLTLPKANFHSFLSVSASESGVDERQVSGSLSGTWSLALGGVELLSLENSKLLFDDHGGLRFQIDPLGVKLPDFLKFVTEKLAALIDPNSGLSFGSVPGGFRCTLDLPVPDTGGLTTGVSGLRLSTGLALLFSEDFQIELSCGLGRPEAPFNVAFFVLGGGGYFLVSLRYSPSTSSLQCAIQLSITASASLEIALGPLRGGVFIYLGVTAKFQSGSSANAFGVVFIIRGDVCLCGIVSASITLSLSAKYTPGDGTLTGTGRVVISIKICWCFTLNIDEAITYSLKAGQAKQTLNQSEPVYLAYGNGDLSHPPLQIARTLQAASKQTQVNPRLLTPREAARIYSKMLV
jgi:hypothetical protein